MKKIMIIVLLIALVACGKKEPERYSQTSYSSGFDTVFQLIGYTESKEKYLEYFELMETESMRYHMLFDKFHTYENLNNIKTINDNAGIAPVKVHQDIIDLLLFSKEFSEESGYSFDVSLGALITFWQDLRDEGKELNGEGIYPEPPTVEQVEAFRNLRGYEYIEIDEEASTVYITNKDISIDVGSVAKGYAVEKVAQKLYHAGLVNGVLNGGGNVRILGDKPDNELWGVGIESPTKLGNVDVINIGSNYSLVTSGDYERYYIDSEGTHQHHLIDPVTLFPVRGKRSVTVIMKDSGKADALSTVLFVKELSDAVAFVEQYNLSNTDDPIHAVWIFDEMPTETFPNTFVLENSGFYLLYTNNTKEFSKNSNS